MTSPIARREFLAGSLAAGTAATLGGEASAEKPGGKPAQEFYELRIYRCVTAEKRQQTLKHLEGALLPALRRCGASRIGTFTVVSDKPDHSIHVLILYPTLDVLGKRNAALAADKKFQKGRGGLLRDSQERSSVHANRDTPDEGVFWNTRRGIARVVEEKICKDVRVADLRVS